MEDPKGITSYVIYKIFCNLIDRSSSVMNLSEEEMDHKKTLQELNTRLVSYVEKVRKLQMATDVIDAMPKQKGVE